MSLQVLRAVAALLVLVHHAGYDADTLAARAGTPLFALDAVFDWTFGIHLFFVISGFIMVRTARGFGSPCGAATFAVRRVIRVVPLYWLMTSLVIAGALVAPSLLNVPLGGSAMIVGSFLFVPVLRADGALNPVLGQGWTLDYEMFFYALFAAAMLVPRRAALPALAAALVALVVFGQVARPGGALAAVWTGELLLEFLFGLGVGLVAEAGFSLSASAAIAAATLGLVAAVALGPLTPGLDGLSPVVRGGVPATLLVAAGVLGPRWPARRSILVLAAIGDASYSLYLSHPFVIRLARIAWAAIVPHSVPLTVYLLASCLGALALSLLLYRGVERPMTLWLQGRILTAGRDRRPILPDAALRDG